MSVPAAAPAPSASVSTPGEYESSPELTNFATASFLALTFHLSMSCSCQPPADPPFQRTTSPVVGTTMIESPPLFVSLSRLPRSSCWQASLSLAFFIMSSIDGTPSAGTS